MLYVHIMLVYVMIQSHFHAYGSHVSE